MESLTMNKVQEDEICIRAFTEEDAEAAAVIEAENFSKPWTREGFAKAVQNKNAVYLVAESKGEILGYAGMWCALDEGEITNVSVKKSAQGRGIGKLLMQALEGKGKEANTIINNDMEGRWLETYLPLASLHITMGQADNRRNMPLKMVIEPQPGDIEDYRRCLSLSDAAETVSWIRERETAPELRKLSWKNWDLKKIR